MDKQFLKRAIELAKTHSLSGKNGPFGAIVVKDGKIIGEGWNQVVECGDPTSHAEIVAIRDACTHLNSHVLEGCTIYSSCEPCPMCLSAIYWARIDRVVYGCDQKQAANAGFDDSFFYKEVAAEWKDRSIQSLHLPSEDACSVFNAWLDNPKKINY